MGLEKLLARHNPLFMDPYDGSVLGQDRGWETIRAAMAIPAGLPKG